MPRLAPLMANVAPAAVERPAKTFVYAPTAMSGTPSAFTSPADVTIPSCPGVAPISVASVPAAASWVDVVAFPGST